jgi:hypothetical protein
MRKIAGVMVAAEGIAGCTDYHQPLRCRLKVTSTENI